MIEEDIVAPDNTFTTVLAGLPFSPATENGRGFLPPIMRTTGHFLYLLGRLSDTPTRRPTDNQISEELSSIQSHMAEFTIPTYLSEQATSHVSLFKNLCDMLIENLIGWDSETRILNLRSLSNRIIQLTASLDREILGLRDSDAGQSL